MTYKKSSVNHSAQGDFKRCLKSMFPLPLVALAIISGSLISNISTTYMFEKSHYSHILFGTNDYFSSPIGNAHIIMLIFGALVALFAFSFVRKVPQVNVYFSLPVTRTTLFANRTKVATLYFAIAGFVPMIIAMILNAILFKPSGYIVGICLMFGLSLFTSAMIGYTVTTAISLAVGKAYEVVLFSVVAFYIPSTILNGIGYFTSAFVNGSVEYMGNSVITYFYNEPINFAYWINPLDFFTNLYDYNEVTRRGAYPKLTIEAIGPILVILCIAGIILGLAVKVFNNRKAEDAGVVGANKPLVVGTGIFFGYVMMIGCCFLGDKDTRIVIAMLSVLFCVVTYLAVTMLLYRNKKNIVSNFKPTIVVGVASVVIVVTFLTGFFGLYNTVPKADKIDYAYAVATSSDGYITYSDYYQNNEINGAYSHDTVVGKITDKDDLELLTSIHQSVSDQLDDGEGTFKVVYVMKNGDIKVRNYYSVGDEASKETLKLYDTKAYKEQVQFAYTEKDETFEWAENGYYDLYENDYTDDPLGMAIDQVKFYQYAAYGSLDARDVVYLANDMQTESIKITQEDATQLKACIAKDMADRTSTQICQNESNATYYLCFFNRAYEYDDGSIYKPSYKQDEASDYSEKVSVPIYADMENTMAYIKENNLTIDAFDPSSIKSARYIDASDRFKNDYLDYESNYMSDDLKDDMFSIFSHSLNRYDTPKYKDCQTITDKSNLADMYQASRNEYAVIGDEGKVALFLLEDGSFFTAYIPEDKIPAFIKVANAEQI